MREKVPDTIIVFQNLDTLSLPLKQEFINLSHMSGARMKIMEQLKKLIIPFVFFCGCHSFIEIHADPIEAQLHLSPRSLHGSPIWVSFGLPFPKGRLAPGETLHIRLKNTNTEIISYQRTLLPWRNITTGEDLPSVRSLLIQFPWTFNSREPVSILVDIDKSPEGTLETAPPPTENWVPVNTPSYPAKYGVYEPPVYVTLPATWLCHSVIKCPSQPFFSDKAFLWNDNLIMNATKKWNGGENFFHTMVNAIPHIAKKNRINYLDPGHYEPWLLDRAMTLYTFYIRSGTLDHLQEAHRAVWFYKNRLDSSGYFSLKKTRDLKYSYNESLLTDLLLTGDANLLESIENVTKAAFTFDPVYRPRKTHGIWTERHLAISWLATMVAYEATGHVTYAKKTREMADAIFQHQAEPPNHPDHGRAPNTGALMHGMNLHEEWELGKPPYWIFSPWMTTLIVDALERYAIHSDDARVWHSAMRFGDAVIDHALEIRELKGRKWTIPAYLAGDGANYSDSGPWTDREHAYDVAKITAFAWYASIQSGQPDRKYSDATRQLLRTADSVFSGWIRPQSKHHAIYRLQPPRKGNWWFRTTSNLDWLLSSEIESTGRPAPSS